MVLVDVACAGVGSGVSPYDSVESSKKGYASLKPYAVLAARSSDVSDLINIFAVCLLCRRCRLHSEQVGALKGDVHGNSRTRWSFESSRPETSSQKTQEHGFRLDDHGQEEEAGRRPS